MVYQTTIAPAALPVPLTLYKQQLNLPVDEHDRDDLLNMQLAAATEKCEGYASIRSMKQTVVAHVEEWTINLVFYALAPVLEVSRVEYLDENEEWQVYAAENYKTFTQGIHPRISLHGSAPTLSATALYPLKITLLCGYSEADAVANQQAAVPQNLVAAILLEATRLHQTRENASMQPGLTTSAERLLSSLRTTIC